MQEVITIRVEQEVKDRLEKLAKATALSRSSSRHDARWEIILDVAGEEKQRLTVQDLLNEFAKLKGDTVADDKMLLI